MTDPAEQQATQAVFGEAILKIDHSISFAPVLAVFPYFDRRAAELLNELNEFWIVSISTIGQKDLVVLRDELCLELIDITVNLAGSIDMSKFVRNLGCRQSAATYTGRSFCRYQ